MFGNTNKLESVENHVPNLLLVTGVLYVLSAVNTGVVFVSEGYDYQAVSGPLLLLGLLASILALLGIYSKARDSAPTWAKATGAVATLALVAVVVLLLWGIGSRVGPLPDAPASLAIVALVLFVVSFAAAGVTVLRSSVYTRLVGYLLVAEAIALVLVFVVPAVVYQGQAPAEATMGIELVQAALLLCAGWLIREGTGFEGRETVAGARDA